MILRVVWRIQLQKLTARIQFQDAKLADTQSYDMTDSDPKLIGDSTSYSHFWWKVNGNFPGKSREISFKHMTIQHLSRFARILPSWNLRTGTVTASVFCPQAAAALCRRGSNRLRA